MIGIQTLFSTAADKSECHGGLNPRWIEEVLGIFRVEATGLLRQDLNCKFSDLLTFLGISSDDE